MATDNQKENGGVEEVDSPDESENVTAFQWWKFVMAILAGVGAYLNSLSQGQPGAYAAGAAFGQAIMIAIFLAMATGLSRKYSWLQVDSVRPRLYAGLCITSAVIGAFGGLLGISNALFVLSYLVFLTTAVIGETLVGANRPTQATRD